MGYLTAEYTKTDNFERQWKNQHIWFVYKLFNVAQCSLNAEGSSRLSSRVAVPSPWGKTGRRECLRRAGTNRVMWRQSNYVKLSHVNKLYLPGKSISPPVLAHTICSFAVFFSVSRPFFRFLLFVKATSCWVKKKT